MLRDLCELRTIAEGLDHPECVTVGPDGRLFAGGEAGQVYRISISSEGGSFEQIADVGGFVLGLCCDASGAIYACDAGNARVVRIDAAGELSTYCDSASGDPLVRPNFALFEPDGTMWLSDSGSEYPAGPDGRLVRIPPGGGDGELLDLAPLHFPNGLAHDVDGSLLVVETFHRPGIVALRDENVEQVVSLPNTAPDGVVVTQSGSFYISCYQPHAILRLEVGADAPETVLNDWRGTQLRTPTNTVFFGEGLRSLAIASLAGWSIKSLELPEAGRALHYPSL